MCLGSAVSRLSRRWLFQVRVGDKGMELEHFNTAKTYSASTTARVTAKRAFGHHQHLDVRESSSQNMSGLSVVDANERTSDLDSLVFDHHDEEYVDCVDVVARSFWLQ